MLLIKCDAGTFQARAGITEVHFLPFNPTDKRTALTYIDGAGNMHRVSKGAPEQVFIQQLFNYVACRYRHTVA